MTAVAPSKKRKHATEAAPETFNDTTALEMLSDEEDSQSVHSDDGEVDNFPEIDAGSDSSDDESYLEGSEDEDEEDEEELTEGTSASDDDEELHIFPKAKTVTSDITGQPKRVYPEIEPDYDSDSSTEDARTLSVRSPPRYLTLYADTESRRQCAYALVR